MYFTAFSCIWTGYEDLLSKFPYSVQMRKNTDQEKLPIWARFTQCEEIQIMGPNFQKNNE